MNQAALHKIYTSKHSSKNATDLKALFDLRLATNLTLIKDLFFSLYPEEKNTVSFQKLLKKLPQLYNSRSSTLQKQDVQRLEEGEWYKSAQLIGTQLYVDHFNKNLKGLEEKIGYFEKLGVNFLHLMPITTRPKGENDGGYAVNSYHEVDSKYGSKNDLLKLTSTMRDKNMLLMLDFVGNHTSDEYSWAKKAKKGDPKYQNYYYTFSDRQIPNEFEKSLPEVFPLTSPNNFTYNDEMQKWVMTVFNNYQWDLNYSNSEVFIEMFANLIKMVNAGVDVVRVDALAFMWKKLGTTSQNLPEAHTLISLFRMCLQVVAPGVIFLAEAIVSPKEIIKYFGTNSTSGNECEIAYNATLMALMWDAIATKKACLLYKNLSQLPQKPKEATWINYIRCHDDIGLGFEDRYITEIGWNAKTHRKFLLDYFSGAIEWSPAKGALFMFNPKTGDGRITGSCASLLGMEKALAQKDQAKINMALAKIVMLHGIIMSYGGVPLIYSGDEIGTLNDYSYLNNSNKQNDSRWINRPQLDWNVVDHLDTNKNYQSTLFFAIQHLIHLRKSHDVLSDTNNLALIDCSNPHLFIFERTSKDNNGILVICNFNDTIETIDAAEMNSYSAKNNSIDLISGKSVTFKKNTLVIQPYQLLWVKKG